MPIKDQVKFINSVLRSPASIGAVAPSSKTLARHMVKDFNIETGQHVLEFGPGTGPFTRALINEIPNKDAYLGIERDPRFVQHLAVHLPDMRVIEGSAEDVCEIIQQENIKNVKAIISGLPFASLSATVQDNVINALDRLVTPGCIFRTFQYVHAYPFPSAVRFRNRMNELFGPMKRSKPVVRNIPPAYVLSWSR